MTQSNFKYDSRQAGSTLFDPQAKGKTFQEGYYRRPIENITNALEKNKQIEANSGRHTRDQVLDNMKLEATQAEITTIHDMEVERLNQQYDMEQWSKFSKAAGELFTMWGEARKARQQEEAYLALSQFRVTDPKGFDDYIKKVDAFHNANGDFNQKLKAAGLEAFAAKDLHLAQKLLSASHWHKQTIQESVLAEKINNSKYFYNQYVEKKQWSFPELGVENMTYSQWQATKPDMAEDLNKQINAKFISANIVKVRKDHFISQGLSPEMIVTKVDPALATITSDESLDQAAEQTKVTKNQIKESHRLETKTAIIGGLGLGGNYSAQEIFKLVDRDWQEFQKEGMTEKEARGNSLAEKLEIALAMHDEGEKGVSTIQLHQLANGEIFGGKEPGQHRGLATGTSKELQDLAPEVFARVNFWNRIQQVDMAKYGIQKYNQENAKKMAVQAVVDQVRETGKPLSQVEHIEFARSLAERGYGKFSELFNAIEEGIDTIHGISVDGWVKEFKKAKERKGGLLNREDFPLGIPDEAFEQAKDLFHKDPKYHIKLTDQRALQKDFGKQVAIEQGKTVTGETLPGHEYYNAGIKAYQSFAKYYDAEVAKGTDISPETARQNAISKVMADIGTDSGQFMGELEPITNHHRAVEGHQKQLNTGKVSEVVLEGFEDRMKWAQEHIANARANGYKGPIINLFPGDIMYRPEDGSPPIRFFDELWDSTAAYAGGTNVLLKGQLKAIKQKDNTKPVPPADDSKPSKQRDPYHWPELDSEVSNQLFNMESSDIIGLPFQNISAESLVTTLGISENFFADRSMAQFTKEFLRKCGLKNSDVCTEEMVQAMTERIWRLYGPSALPDINYNMEEGWLPPQWRTIDNTPKADWWSWVTGRQSTADYHAGMEMIRERNRRNK